jgi:hypothetical protein
VEPGRVYCESKMLLVLFLCSSSMLPIRFLMDSGSTSLKLQQVLAELLCDIDLRLAILSLELSGGEGYGIWIISVAWLARALCVLVLLLDSLLCSIVR